MIRKIRLSWLAQFLRLLNSHTAQFAPVDALRPARRPVGKPNTTWVSRINEDLREINPKSMLRYSELIEAVEDSKGWNALMLWKRRLNADKQRDE